MIGSGLYVASHLKRMDSFPATLDILVNSFYDPDTNEEAVFEERIGFHGGLGGYQTQPFILSPGGWGLDSEHIARAEQAY